MQKVLLQLAKFLVFLTAVEFSAVYAQQRTTIPALIVFGDSIVDAGNNNNIKTLIKCNFPPYGKDFLTQSATGRFCNGKIVNDIIVSEVGLRENLPAYLDPNLQDNDLLTGVTFASGGAGLDDLTSTVAVSNYYLAFKELKLFKEYMARLTAVAGVERTNYIVSNAQYLLVIGNNDIWSTYFTIGLRRKEYDVPSYADLLVAAASKFTKELYALGGRRILIFGLPPLGCVPFIRTLAGGFSRECADGHNQASLVFNDKLQQEILTLNQTLEGSVIAYLDVYYPLLDMIQNPAKYGFEEATKGCCGTGKLEVLFLCNQYTATICEDVSKYVFWDSFHPTERAYRILVDEFIRILSNCLSFPNSRSRIVHHSIDNKGRGHEGAQ